MKATIETPPVGQIALKQLAILVVAVVGLIPVDVIVAYSVLIGGVIQIGPQAYFTRLAFRYTGARQAPKILRTIHRGETGKLLLTAVLFGLAFKFVTPIKISAVFLSYVIMIIMQWFFASKALNHKKI